MKPAGWKVLFFAFPLTLILFTIAALFFSIVVTYMAKWAKSPEGFEQFVSYLSVVLSVAVLCGFKWSRGKSQVEDQPLVPWLMAVPMAVLLTITLAVLFDICWVAVLVAKNFGLSATSRLSQFMLFHWKTNHLLPIIWHCLATQPFLVIALIVSSLFGYYGPVSKEMAELVSDTFENMNP